MWKLKAKPIVAVVDDMKYEGLAAPRTGSIYVPWPRAPTGVSHLVVRTTGDSSLGVTAVLPWVLRLHHRRW